MAKTNINKKGARSASPFKVFTVIAALLVVVIAGLVFFDFLNHGPSTSPNNLKNITKETQTSKKISFLAFGDSGTGSIEQKLLAKEMGKLDFDFLIHTGDVAYFEGTKGQIKKYVLDIYADIFKDHKFYPTLGNHDYYTDAGQPYLDTWVLPKTALNKADQGRYYSFDAGAAHFVALDSNMPLDTNDAESTTDMFDWLRADLEKAKESGKKWTIVYFHHPPFSTGEHGQDFRVQTKLIPIFDAYHVDLVLNGHDHDYERTCFINLTKFGQSCTDATNGTLYIVTGGGGGVTYKFQKPLEWFTAKRRSLYHFLKINVDDCQLKMEAEDITGVIFDTYSINKCIVQTFPEFAFNTRK